MGGGLTELGRAWAAAAAADMAARTQAKDAGGFKPKVLPQRGQAKREEPPIESGLGLAACATVVMVVVAVGIAVAKLSGADLPLPGFGPSDVVQLDANNFDELALNGGKAAFVKFLAPWYAHICAAIAGAPLLGASPDTEGTLNAVAFMLAIPGRR